MRRTIAVLTDYLDHLAGGYETELRRGFEQACRARDLKSIVTVHAQCGCRSAGVRGGRWIGRTCAFGLVATAVASKVGSSMS